MCIKDAVIEGQAERLAELKSELARKEPLALIVEQFAAEVERDLWQAREVITKMERVIDRLQLRNAKLSDHIEALQEELIDDLCSEIPDGLLTSGRMC